MPGKTMLSMLRQAAGGFQVRIRLCGMGGDDDALRPWFADAPAWIPARHGSVDVSFATACLHSR
ncbi:hypothetical protein BOSE62_30576 [Bosea sp. 62]|nr:hypothetical protein BOSE7B_40121 [Bosea sp. 7B]VVT56769.1 hypothetical protein BOS5A_170121 [Bosea sp. EC-HK365B]VXB75617.1 hypothetical protein BOSE29B_120158 [Bosea sp. 29B]VXC13843.1 hypothetical protein BOSE125_180010 [Bosea sp. 125]VXC26469.1 hypothetical protein BOSE62_30576 [Bosea sp. 62]VXC74464.1 hypothetical protein BOSE127_40363 [Bosea sp. 127]